MSARVLLVACRAMPEGDGDDDALPAALDALGIGCEWAVWGESDVDSADLVVLRASWDYTGRLDEFLRWCDTVPRLANPAAVVRWNADKSYLVELAEAGVPTVPTELVRPGQRPAWPSGEFVVKPAVGAGSRRIGRFAGDAQDAAAAHLAALHADGHTALVQPYQSDVDTAGETSLVFLGGLYSHAFTKGPMLTGASTWDESELYLRETLGAVLPGAAERALAEGTLDATAGLLGIRRAELLYARVDVVRGPGGRPLLLELELIEPTLGFALADAGAPLRFASAVRAALD